MSLDLVVLVSAGQHPISARARRAEGDARAVELGLSLRDRYGARLRVVHAGDPDQPALRDYLGMGLTELTVLELPAGFDALPPLSHYLRNWPAQLVLTGAQTEQGFGSGQLPYALAAALDYPIVTGIAGIELGAAHAELCQALSRGRRRALRAGLPAVVSVAQAAPAPRQYAFARARGGVLVRAAVPVDLRIPAPLWLQETARTRPARASARRDADAGDRLRAIRDMSSRSGQLLDNLGPDDAARAIHAALAQAGVLRS